MKNKDNYFTREGQESFVDIFEKDDIKNGQNFPRHWHEHLQIYYFIKGTAKLECGKNCFEVQEGDLAVDTWPLRPRKVTTAGTFV